MSSDINTFSRCCKTHLSSQDTFFFGAHFEGKKKYTNEMGVLCEMYHKLAGRKKIPLAAALNSSVRRKTRFSECIHFFNFEISKKFTFNSKIMLHYPIPPPCNVDITRVGIGAGPGVGGRYDCDSKLYNLKPSSFAR